MRATLTPDECAVARRIGKRVREARVALGLSQTDLAFAARMDRTTLNKIERGKRARLGVDRLCAIATALGVPAEHFLAQEFTIEVRVNSANGSAFTPCEVFGRRLREERERQQISLAELARRLDAATGHRIDRSALARYERGETKADIDFVVEVALALGCAPIHLISPQEADREIILAKDGRRRVSSAQGRKWIAGESMLEDSDPREGEA